MTDSNNALKQLLETVAQGALSPDDALKQLKYFSYEPIQDFARIDHHRALRTGFPEVIWGPGKTVEQLIEIFKALDARQANETPAIATRIDADTFTELNQAIPDLHYFPESRICATRALPSAPRRPGVIGLVSAGTSDLPVAEEAATMATYCGFQVNRYWDIGVAGIHRLLSQLEAIAQSDVLIVVAGMEGALASVVAGLVDCPVIAVPTSVGYGANFAGVAPLLTMLNSCASGIGVVNIDNGFGAAMLAGKILGKIKRDGP
ncbi:MAG: nickel pincer cofactor biosynthesis protein LarB [Cyanobacteria bacterium P01_F01_bin.86]